MRTLLLRPETLTALNHVELAELRGGTAVTGPGLTCYGCITSTARDCITDHCTWTAVC